MADAAYIAITPNAPINESVFTPGSYVVQNFSTGGVQITSVAFDISTALFPGLVFDPSPTGSSGNELGKPFTVDQNIGGITANSTVTNPYQGEIGQLLTVTTGSFDPSDKLAFSIDIDPGRVTTSDPAAGPQGKMIGLELIGSTVTVTFSDGTIKTGEVFTDGSVGGAEILLDDSLLAAPTVTVAGTTGGVGTLSGATTQVSVAGGPANGVVRLLVVRGIDELLEPTTDPYEAHRATDMRYIDVQLGADGSASLSLDLSAGGTWALGGGIFHVTGAVIDGQGDAQSLVSDISRVRVATDADIDTDGDGLINGKDRFALDATNGANKNLSQLGSITLDFGTGANPFQTGFTGVMSNGQESHTQLGISGSVSGGVLTVQTTGGDANGALNTQKNGYQFGVDTSGVQTFTVETKVFNPFLGGVAVENYRQAGLQIGAGNQDDYAKLVLHSNNGAGGIEFMTEMGFVPDGVTSALGVPLQNIAYAMLYMDVAKTASGGTITPRWTLHDAGGAQIGAGSQAAKAVSGSLLDAIQGDLTTQGVQSELAVGVISTSFGSSGPVSASWDHLKISTSAAPAPQALAVNAGGPAVTTGGVNYLADQYFTGGSTFSVTSAIANTTDDAVYQTERYGSTFSYAVPVANGSYSVTLKFAELWHNAAGQRVFDVSAEGALVLDNLDVFAAAGGKLIAKDFVVPVTVTDGVLNLQFVSSVDNAKIDAIQITPVTAPSAGVSVVQSGGSTAVTEGGATDTLSVSLSSQPTASVTVTVGGNADVGVAPTTLTFTTANWNQAQTVTVSAVDDTLVEGAETGSVTFATSSADTGYNNLTVAPVSVAVTDNDTAPSAGVSVVQSGGSTAVTEGGATDTLSVSLSSQPTASVTVTVGGNADVGAAPTTLTFTTANWNQAQTVTVSAVDDTLVEGAETGSVTFATSSADTGYNNLTVAPVSVAVTDNDTAPQALAVNAGGPAVTTGGVNYLADQYFTGGSTFSVTSAIANTTDDAVYQTERYGSTFSYAVPVANGSYSVTLKFAELWHNAAGQRVFDVSAEGALVLDNLDVFAAAGGKLIAKDFVVPVTVTDGVLNLQFVSSVDNAKIDAIQITPVTAPSAGVSVVQSGGSTAVTEGGATDTLSVSLSSQPTASVTVTVGGNADVGAAPTTLTFTTANWNQAQTVTVSAVDDTLVEGAETGSVTFATSSADTGYNNLTVAPVSVAVTDNDTAPQALAVNAGGPAVTTGGVNYLADQYFTGGSTFSVTSAIANTTDDAVYQTERYGSTFSYAVPVANGSYSVTLKFAELWHNAAGQRVFDVSAEGALVLDNLDVFAAAGGKLIAKDFVVPVTVTDGVLNLQFVSSVDNAKIDAIQITPVTAPSAGVSVVQSGGSTAVTEGGATDTLSVSLSSQPTASVTVTVGGNADVGVAPTTLTFTTANWNQAQTVTVSAVDDTLVEGAETGSVTFATSSADTGYNNLTVAPVSVAVTDNDTAPSAGVSVVQSGGSTAVTEGGATDTLSVSLASQPTASVTVTVGGNADVGAAPTTLTFTTANWNQAQTVTVSAVDDTLVEGAETGSVTFATSSADTGYNNLTVAPVSVAVTDNDTAPSAGVSVVQSGGSTAVTEGGATDTLSVSLASQPTASVTVTVGGNADVGAAPTTLTFTTANWNQAQTVTVSAVDDTLVEGPETGSVTFATSSADTGYNNLTVAPVSVAVTDNDSSTPNFTQSGLGGLPDAAYTSLQFGPDGRLYLAQVDGTILAFQVQQAIDGYEVAPGSLETINAIKSITNFNDDGSLAPSGVQGARQVTGILVTADPSSPTKPVIYVSSSDPRIGAGPTDGDVNLDTNSGVVSKLTQNPGGGWDRVDLVRGFARSEENHSVNGMVLSPDGSTMYLAVGGNTNNGAPSHNFAYLPEYATSAAIVSIDLATVEAMPTETDAFGNHYKYDLPTLPPGASDPYPDDPFGGRDGLSQARIVAGGPVQVYSPGYRNPYDIVLTESGRIYTVDNGANAGWGGIPIGEGTPDVTNQVVDGGPENPDHLHLVTEGFYGGFPNPLRANPNGAGWYLDDTGDPTPLPPEWPPVPVANPVEGDFRAPGQDGALYAGWTASTNGLEEYRASTFGGAMMGDLLTVGFDDQLYRVDLAPDGTSVTSVTKLTGASTVLGSGIPLDVTAQGDGEPFAGLIFVANYGGGVTVFTPSNQPPPPPSSDTDGDGLSNAVDRFGEDPANGKGTDLAGGQTLLWSFSQNIDPPGPNGLFNMGFTGLMSNGVDSYLSLYDPANIKPGGAAAGFQIDAVGAGDAYVSNSQHDAFQFGVDVAPGVGTFLVETKIDNPFVGNPSTPATGYKSQGFFIGSGDQDNYLKLVAAANGGAGGIELAWEYGGVTGSQMFGAGITGGGLTSLDTITLRLTVDVAAGSATPSWEYTVGGVVFSGSAAAVTLAGDALSAVRGGFSVGGQPSAMAVGTIATSFGTIQNFPAYWQYLKVSSELTTPTPGLTVVQTGGSTTVTEAGAGDTFTVALSSQPTANVSVTVGGNADVGVTPTTLAFTPSNWNQPQIVSVSAVDDTLVEGAETGSVTFSTSSADADYSNLTVTPVSVTVTDNDTAPQALAVNAGGPAVTTGGVNYLADQYFTGGSTFSVTSAIANTTDDAVYQTERYGSTFSYAVPVANGSYSVTLKFAELYYDAPGQRVFDVFAEGALVVDDLDVWAAAGGKFIAEDIVLPVEVTDGVLNLQFVSSIDNAKVDGILIAPASVGASLTSGDWLG